MWRVLTLEIFNRNIMYKCQEELNAEEKEEKEGGVKIMGAQWQNNQ